MTAGQKQRGTGLLRYAPGIPGIAVLLLSFFCFSAGCGKQPTPSVKVGLGETVITPEENLQMQGFARSQVATGVHDNLHARSMVIEDGEGTATVMMSLSLVGIGREYIERIRSLVTEKTGIPETSILISCNHTHAGPSVEQAPETYQTLVVERAAASAIDAWTSRAPARIGIGATVVMELGRNRRWLLYGGLHPDPEVGIVKIEDAQGNLRGVLFNYGCHPSALDWRNRLYSEDWPYYAIRGIKEAVGEDVWTAYFQSAEGDINVGYSAELSAVGADMPIRNYEYIEHKGKQMSDVVLAALPGIETSGNHDVGAASGFFDYPARDSFPITLAQAEKDAAEAQKKLAALETRQSIEGTRILDEIRIEVFQTGQRLRTARRFYTEERTAEPITVEQQAIRIGDAVFVSVPGEVFSEIGLGIKNASPLEKTFVIGLSNGYGGYMPTEKEFIEGNYEVDGCRYGPTAETVCIESSIELIRRVEK